MLQILCLRMTMTHEPPVHESIYTTSGLEEDYYPIVTLLNSKGKFSSGSWAVLEDKETSSLD